MDKMVLLDGQWQGGGSPEVLEGSRVIERECLANVPHETVPISTDEGLKVAGMILGLTPIRRQTKAALEILRTYRPERVFTIGGGSDADVAPLAYLNQRYEGDLTVVWMGAHGGAMAPEESESHLFCDMPLRILLGARRFTDLVDKPLRPAQVIGLGGRHLDVAEADFLHEQGIPEIEPDVSDVVGELLAQVQYRKRRRVYVHLDLDVLDPAEFSSTPTPVRGGISVDVLRRCLAAIGRDRDIVGLGLYEYAPGAAEDRAVVSELVRVGLGI